MSVVHPLGKIAYVHIAKTGGTAIEKFLKSVGWNGLKRPPYSKVHHVGYDRIKMHCPTLERCYTIVRNPVDKAISAYRHHVFLQMQRCSESDCQKQARRLKLIKQGFLPWFWEHSHEVNRWKTVHQSMYEQVYGNKWCDPKDHTTVFDYTDRDSFWKAVLGFVPQQEIKGIHNYDGIIEKPVLTQIERNKIMKNYNRDYSIWGEKFNWH